jgi:acetyl-CoA carboxylase biotin carboxyl carrier protein
MFDIDEEQIRKLANLLNETGLAEIEFSEGEKRLRLNRGGPAMMSAGMMQMPQMQMPVQHAAPAPTAAAAPAADHAGAVTSPMVGTAYLSPEPGKPAFVKVGDTVKEGQTLLIIEAMKVMNPIKAPQSGTVTAILIQDAKPVEFGEPLLVIS